MSTSSSEYEFDDWRYENYNNAYYEDAYGGNPFYTTMGHPLVYFSQVPQPMAARQPPRERCPNILGRAFRWFTVDRVPAPNSTDITKPNMMGFANWLDGKYEEFLQDGQQVAENNYYRLKMKQTSVIETERLPNNYCEPCTTKKFRVKSPWKKRHRARSDDISDAKKTSSHSLQYLLPPKDTILSGQASEFCPSTATVKSCCHKKRTDKSQSDTDIPLKNKDTVDIIRRQDEGDSRNDVYQKNVCNTTVCKEGQLCQPIAIEHIIPKPQVLSKDFGCQFPEEGLSKTHAETQYDELDSPASSPAEAPCDSTTVKCSCPKIPGKPLKKTSTKNIPGHIDSNSSKKDFQGQSKARESSITRNNLQQSEAQKSSIPTNSIRNSRDFKETSPIDPKVVQSVPKVNSQCLCVTQLNDISTICPRAPKLFASEGVQTFDYAIPITDAIPEYPLFMKIVCADKLS